MEYNRKNVPEAVIRRLPRYHRYLGECLKNGIKRISSLELSKRMQVTASQIRQDLNCFAQFGQQGYGYNVENLYMEINRILNLTETQRIIIMGAGHCGSALANYPNMKTRGFVVKAMFDIDPNKIGTTVADVPVYDIAALDEWMKTEGADIAVLCIPKETVGEVAQHLVDLGIRGLWNFSYADLKVEPAVPIQNMHLIDHVMMLSYQMKEAEL
ncbi:MAG: redox-sensing transcriptional repressor Rex [Clostridia bacterium]|nr:redox-sensing transcriptional repressor Rex [Clostridia bacterium]